MRFPLHMPETIRGRWHLPNWLLLSAAAGCVNGYAFLACGHFATHVTGTATQMGLEVTQVLRLLGYAAVLGCFVAGAAAAFVAIRFRAKGATADRWTLPLLAVALILGGVAVGGHRGAFGPFGGRVASDPLPVPLLSLLAFAAGLQNAAVASVTGLAVRTTHLTGTTTDIGILLAAAALGGGAGRRAAVRGAALRLGTVLAFLAGAVTAVPLAANYGYLAALAPAAAVLLATALSFAAPRNPPAAPTAVGLPG